MENKWEKELSKYERKGSSAPAHEDWEAKLSAFERPSQAASQGVWKSLYKGLSESYPNTLKSGVNALAQPFGGQPFDEQPEQSTTNFPEYLGRIAGKAGGYATLAGPFVAGGEAVIPGLLGASIGSGVAGGALTKGGVRDRLTDALLSSALPGVAKGAGAALRIGKSSLSSVKPRQAADIIQGAHDIAHAEAIAPLNEAAKKAAQRNLAPLVLPKWVTKLVNEKGVFAKTPANKRLLANAKKGDHQSIMDLQSDMFKKSQQLLQSTKSTAENNLGEELEAARDAVKNTMQSHYTREGSKDLADMVKEGMGKYRGVKELFHGNKTISELVGSKKIVPKNLIEHIGKDTAYHERLRQAMPELNKILQRQKDKELLSKAAKQLGYKGGTAAAIKSLFADGSHKED